MLHWFNTNIPDPVAFSIGTYDVMWYGILIAAAMLVGGGIIYYRAPSFHIHRDRILDLILIGVPSGVVGARLYYVAFNWEWYKGDPAAIINLHNGGLAIHGGLIFGIGAVLICCRIWKINSLDLLDLTMAEVALAQSIGRWGNYMNSEAHGMATDLPWAIPVGGEMVHPTFLYESLWCFLLFWVLLYTGSHRRFPGQALSLYLILYSAERFFVEGLRTDSLMVGPLRQAQLISIVLFAAGVAFYFLFQYMSKRGAHKRLNG